MDTKSLRVEVKDAAAGTVTAVIATYDVIDSDGDVTPQGAFEDGAQALISAYGHQSWDGELPVGKGVIRTTKTEALFDGQFFMDTGAGADTFRVVKELGDLGQWSYGYDAVKYSFGDFNGQQVRFLEQLKVHEVSPVLLGAGVNTRTLSAKSRSNLQQEIAEAMDVVSEVIDSAERVVALRAEAGKSLSKVNAEGLDGLRKSLQRLDVLLDVAETAQPSDVTDALAREYMRFVSMIRS